MGWFTKAQSCDPNQEILTKIAPQAGFYFDCYQTSLSIYGRGREGGREGGGGGVGVERKPYFPFIITICD